MIVTQEYTSGSGNWTCPAGVYEVNALLVSGGGGGGGAKRTASDSSGGGGGGGPIGFFTNIPVIPGVDYTYSVGAGGTAGAITPTDGEVGGSTSFSRLTLTGGLGGKKGEDGQGAGGAGAACKTETGGAGGAGTGVAGEDGTNMTYGMSAIGLHSGAGGGGGIVSGAAGAGGTTFYQTVGAIGGTSGYGGGGGGGSSYGIGGVGSNSNAAGTSAAANTGGGGGGAQSQNGTGYAGGVGGSGYILLTWNVNNLAATNTELASVPASTGSYGEMLQFVFEILRHKETTDRDTGVTTLYKDDGSTPLGTATNTDDGTVTTRGEMT